MELDYPTSVMARNAERIRALAASVPDEQARWKPDPSSWSILEVINHLLDEEREDFRVRLDYTLHRPGEAWPPIAPQAWVTERAYNERDLGASLGAFLAEREASMAWLRGLQMPDWAASHETPYGPITAADMLASWIAHDLLHMRQLVELHWGYTRAMLEPHSVDYAGAW